MRYQASLKVSCYISKEDGSYERKETSERFVFNDFEDFSSFLGYIVEGAEGRTITLEIKTLQEEK